MRIHFPNLARPRKAAKTFARLVAGTSLSKAQAAVAVACGYRDWHDLEVSHAAAAPAADPWGMPLRSAAADATLSIARDLGASDGAVQHALAASRLLGARDWRLEDHLAIRAECFRRLGRLAGCRTVEVVPYWGAVAYKVEGNDRYVWTYRGQPTNADREDWIEGGPPIPDFVPPRLYLPYGKWGMGDGSAVLFSRDYKALWRLVDGSPPERLDPDAWIDGIVTQEWFWVTDADPHDHPERMAREHRRLEAFGIKGLPGLVDQLPDLVRGMRAPRGLAHAGRHLPRGNAVLSYRGADGGTRHGLPSELYARIGGTKPWHQLREGAHPGDY